MNDELAAIAARYRAFGEIDAAPTSPRYAELSSAVAADEALLRFLAELPETKCQPNLLCGAVRYLFGVPADAAELRARVGGGPARVRDVMLSRATQTNEAARVVALLPLLGRLDGPLALMEIGASAGLCLYPDRFSYDYDGRRVGEPSPAPVVDDRGRRSGARSSPGGGRADRDRPEPPLPGGSRHPRVAGR